VVEKPTKLVDKTKLLIGLKQPVRNSMIQMKSGNSAIIELKKEVVKEVALVKSARQEPKQ
jgi:hypothetical protein